MLLDDYKRNIYNVDYSPDFDGSRWDYWSARLKTQLGIDSCIQKVEIDLKLWKNEGAIFWTQKQLS